ncbi:Digestive cysteine proteinase 3-like 4 [Homarus americanus]|uniref:Digestive cysteine proteinase 3-like 4 n=1 Tax=Homarus americanus TaxID=6706 RepID=A0A8J5JIS3_HOMAM|nr:Digestive cysteine proteinase 3-like 4 [Homarus americanus]
MKVTALFLCGLALATASPSWEHFKAQHGRKYVDAEEELFRQRVFQKNEQFIEDFNKKFERGEVTFNVAMNQFGDMTNEEFNAVMKGYKMGSRDEPKAVFTAKEGLPMAADVDWRTKGAVTPVKDQGQCGSCWAFSTTGSLEGQHFLKYGELVSLSEQQLVDCAGGIYFNQGCNGGWDKTCRFNANSIGATLVSHVDIAQGSETGLQQALSSVGPISVAIDASHFSFQFYHDGVYYEPNCSSTNLDHAVLAVGYGSEGSQDYWLVKNSWASTWGLQGYIKMARNRSNHCGVASAASYPTV